MRTRRPFLLMLFLAAVSMGLAGRLASGQNPLPRPPSTPSAAPESDSSASPVMDKKILESNDKDMKKKVQQLYELASQLKEEVEKTDSSKVLSVDLLKKAEEIEKLAHDIRSRGKG